MKKKDKEQEEIDEDFKQEIYAIKLSIAIVLIGGCFAGIIFALLFVFL